MFISVTLTSFELKSLFGFIALLKYIASPIMIIKISIKKANFALLRGIYY